MKNSTRYVLIAICIIMILLTAGGLVWAFANKFSNKAYADYEDLNNDTLVNFNQLFSFDSSNSYGVSLSNGDYICNGSYLAGNWYMISNKNINLDTTHIYYFYIRQDSSNFELVVDVSAARFRGETTFYGSPQTNGSSGLFLRSNSTATLTNYKINTYVIDLTLMFGVGNEPNLEQCKDYFIADYYNYTPGQAMPYSKDYLQGYQQGIIDFQNSVKTTFNNDVIGSMSFAANIGGIESTIAYDAGLSAYLVDGIAGIHFGNAITSQIEFYIEFFLPSYSGGLYFIIFNYSNGTLIPISTDEIIDGTATTNAYVRSVFNVNNMDTLYFGVFDSTQQFTNNTKVSGYFFKSELTINTIDIAALITQAIGQTQADYLEGGAGYESIYNQGYYAGVAHGNATLETMDYIGAAFTGIGSILQIQLLPGIPFSIFILLPLMFGLIAFVIKLSKGGS